MKYTHTLIQLMVALVVIITGCEIEPIQKLPERNFELVWSDEFVGDSGSLPDSDKWTFDLGGSKWLGK